MVLRPTNAVNPRKAKALAARNMRAEPTTAAAVVVVVPPGSEVTLYDLNPPAQANGYTWLFVELGTQYAGYVVEALGDANSFEVLPVEPPPDAVFSVWLTDDEIRQSAQLHTIVAQAEAERMAASQRIKEAHLQLAAILTNALERARPTVLDGVAS